MGTKYHEAAVEATGGVWYIERVKKYFVMAALFLQMDYNQIMQRCDLGSAQKPVTLVSEEAVSPKGKKAHVELHCWFSKEKSKHFAMSELYLDGKKVYFTPPAALLEYCGSAAGEIYRPHNWSPDGKTFVFALHPYCWETEPFSPVVMFHQESKTFAPNLTPIADEIFKKYPEALKRKTEIQFIAQPLNWRAADKLLLSVEIICYGCIGEKTHKLITFPTTFWTITPSGTISFVHEEK